MTERLRRFTDHGLKQFGAFLEELRRDRTRTPPRDLLVGSEFSVSVVDAPVIEARPLLSKREAAIYLQDVLDGLAIPSLTTDRHLWSWLSLYFFDSVCPAVDGVRRPLQDPHYVLSTDGRRSYRHLLLTPFRILQQIPTNNRIFLDAPLNVHGDLIDQTMGRLYLMRIKAVREVIDRLYFDESTGRAKRGILPTQPKPGDLRNRLPVRIRQLQMTYDIDSMSGTQLIERLGAEFKRWNRQP